MMNQTSPIRRVTIFCRNIEKSLRLYRDILGFTVIEEKTIQTQEFSNLMNIDIYNKEPYFGIIYDTFIKNDQKSHFLKMLSERVCVGIRMLIVQVLFYLSKLYSFNFLCSVLRLIPNRPAALIWT